MKTVGGGCDGETGAEVAGAAEAPATRGIGNGRPVARTASAHVGIISMQFGQQGQAPFHKCSYGLVGNPQLFVDR